jgi:hypothetical protein
VREFITHGKNGLLVPFLKPQALARSVLNLLDDKALTRNLRADARAYAEKTLGMEAYLASYNQLIERLTGENPTKAADPEPPMLLRPRPAGRRGGAADAASAVVPVRKRLVTAA